MKKFLALILLLMISGNIFSQNDLLKKYPDLKGYKIKDFWQITAQGGFMYQFGILNDNYYTSPNAGFDISYRLNREVALYAEFKYNFLSAKDSGAPAAGYFEATVGPRYYFRPPCYRSSVFIEAGLGTYIFNQSAGYTPKNTYLSATQFRFGANIGIGGEIVLTNSVFITIKSKVNSVFTSYGSSVYVTGGGGITFRL